jgi:hypothetical protein
MRAKRAFSACKLFDPFFLASDPSINALNALADELVHFGYPEFDEDFIIELKKEIPEAIKAFDRDAIRNATNQLFHYTVKNTTIDR